MFVFSSPEIQSVISSDDLSSKQENIPQENESKQVEVVVKIEVDSQLKSIRSRLLKSSIVSIGSSGLTRSSQLSNQLGKERTVIGFENPKLKLCFINQMPPTIFTNNEIKAKNGKALVVAICDNTTNSKVIIKTGFLSRALVEFVVLDDEFGFNLRREKNNCWSWNDFNESIVSERVGKRPLIVGNGKIILLENGFGQLNDLSFSDNSSWTKTKKFRLGVKFVDEEIKTKFPGIEGAVSEPFRVMDQRGEGYKKHHPPSRKDEVWRLEGIAKNGAYHQRLSSNGIENVDDLLKVYKQKGSTYLKQLLGEKIPEKIWSKMINNALECDSVLLVSPSFNPTPTQHLGENYKATGAGQGFEGTMGEQDEHYCNNDYPPLLPHGEASTSYQP
ncbi:calmodulin-binding protein 60 G-like [Cucumis sativus]|uniref:calmodulin-binding protein 60 G-like n=1 Tax=Cucumis sativus TaxID=3659 RepID=UPI0012F50FBD|nr:calmodulin-binding protein 60 G-like [Cucumis sativus]